MNLQDYDIAEIPVAMLAVAGVNQMTNFLNASLTAIFYLASIAWLGVQVYYKIKNKGK